MSLLNVPLNELTTTEGLDFSYRGTPLQPQKPEHYVNKQYVDHIGHSGGRPQAVVTLTCDGVTMLYPVPHDLNTTNIASVMVYNTTDGRKIPVGVTWEPTDANTITLKPDILLPATMSLLIVIS